MRNFIRLCVIALTAGACLTNGTTIAAQNPPAKSPAQTGKDQRYRYRLLGVYDETTGEPVEGVEVRDLLTGMSAQTTKTGTVSLFFVPDGGSMIRLRKVGYELQTFAVAISPADTSPLTIVLKRAVQLPTVTVKDSASTYMSSRLQEAEARLKSHSGGHFIDETEMRKWDNSTMKDAITANMPGVMTTTGQHGESYLATTRTMCVRALSCRAASCYVTIYQDGVKVFDPATSGSAQRLDMNHMTTMDYAIAEYYPSTAVAPPEYQGACGVLLLWTRER